MKKSKGFTLIELVMVIVIIGILAAIAIPRFINLRRDAQQAACDANIGAMRAALANYYARRALANTTPYFPASMHEAGFRGYLSGNTIPAHPGAAFDYDSLWDTTDATIDHWHMNTHTHS